MSLANRFDRMEWAGAFGDLGTLIPFVVAYIAVVHIDPFSILFSFGAALVACGLYYRTPIPVQPMKAIGAVAATQAAQTATITQATLYGADLATGVIWLALGVSGAARRIARRVPRAVVIGIVLGLGLNFMLGGIRMMHEGWLIAALGLLGTLLLALPQLPLTLGNAVIVLREENNRLFPERPVTETQLAISTGAINVASAALGGVPMCHGAGGLAGHVAFGARSGGAPIILGVLLLVLALFFSGSVAALFDLLPRAVLGVILFLTGAQLALGACDFS